MMEKGWVNLLLVLSLAGCLFLVGCDGGDGGPGGPGGDAADVTIPPVSETPLTPGVIRGQVVRGDTQQPQQGIRVEVGSPDVYDDTDENGRFEVTGIGSSTGGHVVTIIDRRTVGTEPGQIPEEDDRLATVALRPGIAATADNTQRINDLGVVFLNPAGNIRVLVTLMDGTPVPDDAALTVLAVPNNVVICTRNVDATLPFVGLLTPNATTGAGGVATLTGLDPCLEYRIVVPAQIVNGNRQNTATTMASILMGQERVTVSLSTPPSPSLALVATNMDPHPAFQAAAGTATTYIFQESQNVHNSSDPEDLENPGFSYTAPSGTGNLVLVFNVPIEEADRNRIRLLFTNELVDPDTDDDATVDEGVGEVRALAVTSSLDDTGTILTITPPMAGLAPNQFYTIEGDVRPSGAEVRTDLTDLLGSIYTSDASEATGDLSMARADNNIIEADNRSGNAGAGPGVVYLVFREAVAGNGRVVSITPEGGTQTPLSDTVRFDFSPSGMTRLVSTNGDPADPNVPTNTDGTCSACLGGMPEVPAMDPNPIIPAMPDTTTRVRVVFAIPGLPQELSNEDMITVDLNVVDVQGNRFNRELTLPVD